MGLVFFAKNIKLQFSKEIASFLPQIDLEKTYQHQINLAPMESSTFQGHFIPSIYPQYISASL